MEYTVRSLTEHGTGAEVRGLDLRLPVGGSTAHALNQQFARYHVLVFRDQCMTPQQFARACQTFGDIMPQHHKQIRAAEDVEVYNIRNEEISPGKYLIAGETFHTDHSDHQVPPKATALHAVRLPSKGGDTQFVNMHNAYDDLSDEMKRRLDGLLAAHVFQSKYSPRALRPLDDEARRKLPPPAMHAIVREHPDNKRRFLYLNPVRIESIVGMSDADALSLLTQLMEHSAQLKYEYRHRWLPGDMVIWDNRSVMHQANGDYDMRETRHLYRLMVQQPPPGNPLAS